MKKSKKITLIILISLITASLIMTAVLSGTFAKFISMGYSRAVARVAKWGIELNAGSDLRNYYTASLDQNNPTVRTRVVETRTTGAVDSNGDPIRDNTVVPGTNGSLAWISLEGHPEVMYNVEFSTEEVTQGDKVLYDGFYVGEGFYAASRMVRDEKGLPTEYFPIIIELCAYDVSSTGTKTVVVSQTHALKSTSDNTASTDKNKLYTSLSDLVTGVNTAIDSIFDSQNNTPNQAINRVYSVCWKWNYTAKTSYQTDFLDTSLCEAIANCSDADRSKFEIGLKMGMKVSQVD